VQADFQRLQAESLTLQADFSCRCKSLQAATERPASTEPQPSTTASGNMQVTEVTEPQEKKAAKSSSTIYARVSPATLERFNGMRRTLGLERNEDLVTRLMDCYEQPQAKLKEPVPSKLAEATEDVRQNRIEPHIPITVFKDPQGFMHFSVTMPRLLFACVKKMQRAAKKKSYTISFDKALSLMVLQSVSYALFFEPDDEVVQVLGNYLLHDKLDQELLVGFLSSGRRAPTKHTQEEQEEEIEEPREFVPVETTFGVAIAELAEGTQNLRDSGYTED
jgi:hypothetical protein